MNKLTFNLSVDQVNLILAALAKAPLPSELTNPVAAYLQEEGGKQIKGLVSDEPPVTEVKE